MDLLWRFLLLQLGGWCFVMFGVLSWMIWARLEDARMDKRPLPAPQLFDEIEPIIFAPYKESWVMWPLRILFWSAYAVFFMVSIPLTIWLWKSGALEGGQAIDFDD